MSLYQAIRTAFIPDAAGSVSGDQIFIGHILDFGAAPTGPHAQIFRPYPVRPYNQADIEVAGGAGKAVLTVQGAGRYPLDLSIYPNDPAAPGAVTTWAATADGQTKDIPYTAAGTYSPVIASSEGHRETFKVTVTAPAPAPPAPTPAPAPARTPSTPAPNPAPAPVYTPSPAPARAKGDAA